MTTLKQFQEESRKRFQENHGQYTSLDSLKEAEDFLQQQISLAYELGKKEMLEIVLKEIEKKWTCHQVGCEWNRNRVYGNKVCDMNCANVLESIK